MRRILTLLLILKAAPAFAAELQSLVLNTDGQRLELALTRARDSEGGLALKLGAKSKPPLVIYEGGGGDEGPGDSDFISVAAKTLEFGTRRFVRVDFVHRSPEGKRGDQETETTLVGLVGGKLQPLLHLVTAKSHTRSKHCRDLESVAVRVEPTDEGLRLLAETRRNVEPAVGDDDEPIDKSCKAPHAVTRRSWRWSEDRLVEDSAAVGPLTKEPFSTSEKPRPPPPPKPQETDD